ncbi:UDP-glucosyltransferase 2-like [Epargyreus clarus]|uniref:UDP-glucosyltransferase 2-like n=1 Tax=Epargyreus clarus TaxID=520877 RepID=UPI003C2F74C6
MEHTVLACVVLSATAVLDAARILAVFPTPSISHQFVFRPITQELARRGHDVTVITADPAFPKNLAPGNLTEIDVHDISYSVWENDLNKVSVGTGNDMNAQLEMFIHLFAHIFEQQVQTDEVQNIIKNKNNHFDLILVEACVRTTLIFSHIYKAPVIMISSFGPMVGTNSIVGAPNHPLFQPVVVRQRLYNLTLWEKIREIYQQYKFEQISHSLEYEENMMLKKIFGPETPSLSELYNNVDMVFFNVHPIWIDNQPVPPSVIYMGGMHQNPEKELPKDLQSYLDSSKHGVIYLSFGTNVQPSVLPPHKIKMMMKVFSELPYDVIWKWDKDLPGKPSNIKVLEWLPQSDLLRHPKMKLFIMQGGLQSTDEAITAGVPLIGIPVIADQWFNVEKYVRHGIGMKLEMGLFSENGFKNAILTVIEDPSYKNNIIRLRTVFRDQPQAPLERVIWWTEYVLRHGGAKHLRAPAANMSWAEYYQVNLVVFLLTCIFIILSVICVILYYIIQFFLRVIPQSIKLKVL